MAQKPIAELDQIKTDGALPAAERQRLVAQLTARIEQLGREEEALIEMAGSQGFAIARRMNASPPIILGVKIVRTAEAAA
jgi:hypothetical protein